MLASMAQARHTIKMESYIFAPDEIGWQFAEMLAARARDGIEVFVHLDAAGSLFWSAPKLGRYLRQSRVRLRWFHHWNWRTPLKYYNRRNHRKLLIIDGEQVYLGGFNIHRECSRRIYGEQRWRDTHVRLSDDLAREAEALFDGFWRGKRQWVAHSTNNISVLMPNHNRSCRLNIRCLYMDIFRRARKTLYVTTPYFVPDRRTQQAMKDAASSGTDVRLLVPRKSDIRLTRWAAQAAYAPLLEAGVRIYEYLPRVIHAKTAVSDRSWCTIGTANLDYRSFFLNFEINLVSRETGLCQDLHELFCRDLEEAVEVLPAQWAQRHWSQRILESIGWMARHWL
ncbi:MAG TPA: cardiolipin synthase B [Gammaproteobacteria bacterium]|nr:cardiolipin synthase B [Gammaproteobacteria bacterium]